MTEEREQCPHCEGFISSKNRDNHFDNCSSKPYELPKIVQQKAAQEDLDRRFTDIIHQIDHAQYLLLEFSDELKSLDHP